MKYKIHSILLFCAAVLAVAAAIFLPPYLSRLADRRLDRVLYEVCSETMDVSLAYTMSTAERLALLLQKQRQDQVVVWTTEDGGRVVEKSAETQDILAIYDAQPAQDELSAEQAATLCQTELDYLFEMGVFPSPVQFGDPSLQAKGKEKIQTSYYLLYDRNSRSRSLSLWRLSADRDFDDYITGVAFMDMDAETGLLYSLGIKVPELLDLEELAVAWGDYLGLGVPTILEDSDPIENQVTDVRKQVTSIFTGSEYLIVSYQTDAGEITYSFQQNCFVETAGSVESITLRISPYTP